MMKAALVVVLLALACFLQTTDAGAQVQPPNEARNYPSKPIRIIVAFAPGGGGDIIARLIAQKLSERWGQAVVVDNRPGAVGIIGTEIAAKAPPDGYAINLAGVNFAINASFFAKLPYDTEKDFACVTMVASAPYVLLVHPSVPVNSVKELVELAKTKPGTLNYGSNGDGSPPHLSGELLKSMADIDIVHIPYNGGGPALNAAIGGQVQMFFSVISAVVPYIKDGRLKPLAVASNQRSSALPDVPTMSEAGLPGLEATNWFAVLTPARTPRVIISRLNGMIVEVLRTSDMNDRLTKLGVEPVANTPEECDAQIKKEVVKWANVVKLSGGREAYK